MSFSSVYSKSSRNGENLSGKTLVIGKAEGGPKLVAIASSPDFSNLEIKTACHRNGNINEINSTNAYRGFKALAKKL